ncbi:MAG: PKD repeat protein [Neolewinella sp.]|jgi:PKD repeat protein
MRLSFITLAAVSLAGTVAAQMPLPPAGNFFTAGTTRGFYFQCPTPCIVTGLAVPDITDPIQVVEFIDFGLTPPPVFATSVLGTQMFYDNTTAAQSIIPVSIPLVAGNYYGVLGCGNATVGSTTSQNPYANQGGPFTSDILGIPVDINRLLTQTPIGSNGGNQLCSSSTGSISRVEVYVAPAAGLFANFAATSPTTGASPLTVSFADGSITDDPAGVATWAWDFDNDGIVDSTAQNPSFTFNTCGSFDVTLTVTDLVNPSSSATSVGLVNTDLVVASFTVAALAPQVWEFTDTSVPTPTSWAWDFDNDGIVDDTNQNGIYVALTASTCLSLPSVSFTATLACNSDNTTGPVFAAANSFIGESGGGNGTASAAGVGNYFDIEVTNPEGINVCGLGVAPYSFSGAFDCNVYITDGTHLGKEGVTTAWSLAGSGVGTATGAAFTAPEIIGVGMGQPFYLPPGNYGVAMFLSIPGGGTANIAYTNGPATAPYIGTDLTIHPAGVGSSATSELGPVAFTPRLFNGGFFYDVCSASQSAATGYYATGCPGSLGVVAGIDVAAMPTLGGTYSLDVTNMPAPGIGVMMAGISKDFYVGLPLPLDLGIVGAAGCLLQQSADITSTLIAPTGTTTANWTLPIPNDPLLYCFKFFNQAAVLDLSANSLGFSFSDAQAAVIGN